MKIGDGDKLTRKDFIFCLGGEGKGKEVKQPMIYI